MTKKEQRRLKADIKRKVRNMMKQDIEWAMKSIDSVALSGCGLLDDHAAAGENFLAPKNLLCALYQDLASPRQYGPTKGDRKQTRTINTYYLYV